MGAAIAAAMAGRVVFLLAEVACQTLSLGAFQGGLGHLGQQPAQAEQCRALSLGLARGDGAARPGAGSSEGGLVFTGAQDEGLIELAGHGGQPPHYAKIQRHAGGQGFEPPELRWSETQLESPGAEYSSEAQRGGTMY